MTQGSNLRSLLCTKPTLDVNERKGQESRLGGGLASEGFLQEVTQAESGEHLKCKGVSRRVHRLAKWRRGQEHYVVAWLGMWCF